MKNMYLEAKNKIKVKTSKIVKQKTKKLWNKMQGKRVKKIILKFTEKISFKIVSVFCALRKRY